MELSQIEIQWLKKIGFKLSVVNDDEWYKELEDKTIYLLRENYPRGDGYQLSKTYDAVINAVPCYGLEETICEGKTIREALLPFLRSEILDDLLN